MNLRRLMETTIESTCYVIQRAVAGGRLGGDVHTEDSILTGAGYEYELVIVGMG